jgi:hypothetical protein
MGVALPHLYVLEITEDPHPLVRGVGRSGAAMGRSDTITDITTIV